MVMERIRELSDDQIDRLKQLGKDTLSAVAPTIASMVYSNNPDQLQALQNIGPDALGSMSPQLADFLYGNDSLSDGDDGVGQPPLIDGDDGVGQRIDPDAVIDPDTAEKGLGRFPTPLPPIVFPPKQPDYVAWWAFEDACPSCLDNAESAPRLYGEAFPSGDVEPPAHDHCRCGLVNVLRGDIDCPVHGVRVYASGYRYQVFELSSRY